MGLNIRLYNINMVNDFTVAYRKDTSVGTYTPYGGIQPAATTTVSIDDNLEFDTRYFVKITDTVTGLYSIGSIYTHDSKYFECYDQVNFIISGDPCDCESYSYSLIDKIEPNGNHSSVIGGNTNTYRIYTGTTYDIVDATFITTATTDPSTNIIYTFTGSQLVPTIIYVFVEHGDGNLELGLDDPKRQGGFEVKPICICCTPPVELEEFLFYANNLSSFNYITVNSNNGFKMDFGDGTVSGYTSGSQNTLHTYSSPFTGNIKILSTQNSTNITSIAAAAETATAPSTSGITVYTPDLVNLKSLTYLALDDIFLVGKTSDLPRGLTIFAVGQTSPNISSNILSGSTYSLPTGLTFTRIEDFNTVDGNTLGLPRPANLEYIAITGRNKISGNTSGFPQNNICSSFHTLSITGDNTITGYVADIPTGLTYLIIGGNNTITGNTNDFPKNIGVGRPEGTIGIWGYSHITGDVANLPPDTDRLVIYGLKGVTGRTENLPRLLQNCYLGGVSGSTSVSKGGKCSISGSVLGFPTGCTAITLYGNNNITGSTSDFIPSMIEFFLSGGTNQIIGNISSLPSSIKSIQIYEGNLISGDTSGLTSKTSLEYIKFDGLNTVKGSINSLPTSLKTIGFSGNNVITGYTSGYQWNTELQYLTIESSLGGVGFTDTQIDNILNDIHGRVPAWYAGNENIIRLKGISSPKRTIASQTAYSNLTGYPNNVTVLLT